MKDYDTSKGLTRLLAWGAMLVMIALAAAPLVPPAPPADPGVEAFRVDNALAHIELIAQEPRPIGSPGNQRGRDAIATQLRAMGLEPEFQSFEVPNYFSPRGERIELVNILVRIPGTAPTTAVALVGHHDTVPTTLGANDDAGAVAIMLEAARAILAGPPLRNDVILVFTDGEEPAPRFGSSAFATAHPWFGDIGYVINLETIGSGGPSMVVDMGGSSRWAIDQFVQAVPFPVAFSVMTSISEMLGGSNTDFATFRDAGIAGVDLAYLTGSPIYHTMADAPESVSARSLHQQGANTLALARHIGNLDMNGPRTESKAVFFTIGRFLVVRYPTTWALPLILLVGVVLIVAGWRQRGWLRMLRSVGVTLAAALIAVAAAIGVWTIIGGWRSGMSIAESYLYLAGLVGLTAGIGTAMAWLTRRWIGTGPDALGVVIVWWLIGLLTAIAAPGMSYLFVWPALAAGLALLWRLPEAARLRWRFARWALVSVTILVVLVPAIDFFYQFAQPRPGNPDSQILALIAIPILLVAMVAELLRVFRIRPTKRQPLCTRHQR